MRLIVNCIFYNESEWIKQFLDRLRQIKDLWAVEMLDGSWQQERKPTFNSTDDSKEQIDKWVKENHVPFEVNYIASTEIWESESVKRNWLLDYTEKKHGRCWILVLDADEVVKFPNGLVSTTLIPDLNRQRNSGIINAYAYNSVLTLPSIRFIPSGRGIHYHTERAMILHDKDCKILMDYNPKVDYRGKETWFYDNMFIVNHWALRNNARQIKKYYYMVYQQHQQKDIGCKWKSQ